MGRAPCCEKVGLKRGRWTAEEDEILINYINKNGEGSWRSLPKNAGLLRCGKSCRLRWINYLRADLKRGNFTVEEEETIIKLHRSVGNRWSLIASHLPGRTDNEVKNYWNSHLSRKIYSFRSSNDSLMSSIDLLKMNNSCKRRGGRVSRSVAKKYNRAMRPHTINGTEEFPATGNAKAFNTRVGQSGARSGTQPQGFTTATEKGGFRPARDEVEGGSSNSMHDSCCEGHEVCHASPLGAPKELRGDMEVLGPYEEPGDVTALLDQFFLSELSDLCKISINNEKVNGTMVPESTMISEENNSGAWHSISNSSSDSGLLEEYFSPLNSCFEDEMAKLHMSDASIGFGLWD